MTPEEIAALVKAIPAEVAKEAYGDAASSLLKQVGKLGEDCLKTFRLALFPVQYAAAFQDRLAAYIDRAVRNVPESRRIAPMQSAVLTITDKLRYQEADSIITDLYVNLLSRAMDGERVGEAHPAFVGVISQLAPDEVSFLKELSGNKYTLILKFTEDWPTPTQEEVDALFQGRGMQPELVATSYEILFRYEALNQPELFYVFLEHLYHLGLVQYTNEPSITGPFKEFNQRRDQATFVFIRLSSFGQLLYNACVSQGE